MKKESTFSYKLSQQKRAFVAALLTVLSAYLLFAGAAILWPSLPLPVVMPVFFLLAGLVYLWLLKKYFGELTSAQAWSFTVALTLFVLLLLACSRFWGLQQAVGSVLAGAGAFLLPFVLAELWRVYAALSYDGAIGWQAPSESGVEFPSIYLNGLPIRFRVLQGVENARVTTVSFLASGNMKLGEAFKDMVQKQAKKDALSVFLRDPENKPFTWIFYTNDMLIWNRVLNPEKSILANGVKRNALIYAQQVPGVAVSQPTTTERMIVQS